MSEQKLNISEISKFTSNSSAKLESLSIKQKQIKQDIEKYEKKIDELENQFTFASTEKIYAHEHDGQTEDGKDLDDINNEITEMQEKARLTKNDIELLESQLKEINEEVEPVKELIKEYELEISKNEEYKTEYDRAKRNEYLKEAAEISEKVIKSKTNSDYLEALQSKITTDKEFRENYVGKIETTQNYNKALSKLTSVDFDCKEAYDKIEELKTKQIEQGGYMSQQDKAEYDEEVRRFSDLILDNEIKENTEAIEEDEKSSFKKFINAIKRFFGGSKTKLLVSGTELGISNEIANARKEYLVELENQKQANEKFAKYIEDNNISENVKGGMKIIEKNESTLFSSNNRLNVSEFIQSIIKNENKNYADNKKLAEIYGKVATEIEKNYSGREIEISIKNKNTLHKETLHKENIKYAEKVYKKVKEANKKIKQAAM